jgi:helix-turn-helix protein
VAVQYVGENEAGETIGYSGQTLRKWRWNGSGPPYYKHGRAVRYDLDELLAWMKSHRVTSTSDSGKAA